METNRSGYGKDYFSKAKQLGHRISMATFDPKYFIKNNQSIENSFLSNVDNFIIGDTHVNVDEIITEIKINHFKDRFDAVVATGDMEIITAAKIAEALDLPGPSVQSVKTARNKRLTRDRLKDCGISQPHYEVVDSPSAAISALQRFDLPCIIKPTDSTDSSHVRLAYTVEEVIETFTAQFSTPNYRRGNPKDKYMLLEEFIEGPLYSVEIFMQQGVPSILGITDRILSSPPYFIEKEAGFPSYPPEHDKLIQSAIDVLKCLDISHGPTHIEFIIKDSIPFLIEVNPRLAGGAIPRIIDRVYGISCAEAVMTLGLGRLVSLPPLSNGYGIDVEYIHKTTGRITDSNLEKILKESKNIIYYNINKMSGDYCGVAQSNTDSLASFAVMGKDEGNASKIKEDIVNKFNITIE